MLDSLNKNGKSAVLPSEASVMLNKMTFAYYGYLNKLWDGDNVEVNRKSSESYYIEDAKLSLALMLQPTILDRLCKRQDAMARKVGLLARTLICSPQSIQGWRRVNAAMYFNSTELHQFYSRITGILEQSKNTQGVISMSLTQDALHLWQTFSSNIESKLNVDTVFCRGLSELKDFASKITNNVLRIAGLIHYFDTGSSEISGDSMYKAITIGCYYINEFARLFATKIEDIFSLAQELCFWFSKKQRKGDYCDSYPKSYLLQYGPSKLRKADKLDGVLNYLSQQGVVSVFSQPGRPQMICVHYRTLPYL